MDKDQVNPNKVTDSFRTGATGKSDVKENSTAPVGTASKAAMVLSGAEGSTTASGQGLIANKDAAQRAESSPSFTSSITGDKGKPSGKTKGKGKGKLKKFGPFGTLLILLLGGGGAVIGSQSLMPFGIVNNLMDTFNSMKTVNTRRSSTFMRTMVDSGRNKPIVKNTIFGNEKFSISNKVAKKLNAQGIEFATDSKGKRIGMIFEQDGVKKLVTVNGKVPSDIKAPVGVDTGSAMKLDAAMQVDGFFTKVDKGTRTFKGHIVGWFDSLANKTLGRLQVNRNKYKDFDSDSKTKIEEIEAKSKNKQNIDETKSESKIDTEEFDSDGNKVETAPKTETDTEIKTDTPEVKADKIKAKAQAQYEAASKVTGIASAVANGVCAIMTGIGVVQGAIAAYNMMQILEYVSGFTEAIQKAQAGGGESPIHDYANNMTKADGGGKSAIQTMSPLFGGSQYDKNSEGVQSFNIESALSGALGAIGSSVAAFTTCTIAKIAAAGVGVVMDIISFIPVIGQGVKLVDFIVGVAAGAGIAYAFKEAIEIATPIAVRFFGRILLVSTFGEEAGLAIMSGANAYMGQMHQGGGGSLGDRNSVIAFHRETAAVLAEEAEYQRRELSPFDITSKYTFFGSIIHSMIPLSANLGSFTGVVTSMSNMTTSAIAALTPTATAMEEANFVSGIREDCPYLSSIGAVGDVFCNPHFISDLSTINMDPGDVYNEVGVGMFDGEDDEGNPIIRTGAKGLGGDELNMTDFGKYIVGCGTRQSTWGSVDMNIANKFNTVNNALSTGDGNADIGLNSVINVIPVGGDIVDIAENGNNLVNMHWISGENCVAHSGNYSVTAVDEKGKQIEIKGNKAEYNSEWNTKYKYYQRYIEDQRLMEAQGMIKKSAVTAYLEEIYEIDPLDNSEAGVLARYMGTTTEEAEVAIAKLEELEFLQTYTPVAYGPSRFAEPTEISELLDIKDEIIADSHQQHAVLISYVSLSAIHRTRTVLV